MSKSYVILANNVDDKQDPILYSSSSAEPYLFFMFKNHALRSLSLPYSRCFWWRISESNR